MLRCCKVLFVLFLALLALELRSAAQCSFTDNLDGGPCCGLTSATLPVFSNFGTDVADICWKDCGVNQVLLARARWTNIPFPVGSMPPCDALLMRLDIVNSSSALMWRGQMRLQYSRTWLVTDTAGLLHQVWRFLLNGDLRPFAAAGPQPCPVPPCVGANGNRAHFTGYLDFAQDCSIIPGAFEYSWMLTHACDAIDHHAGFPRAGAFHARRSYSFVAPAAGFVPGPIQPTEGTPFSPFEAVRGHGLTPPPVTTICTFEEPSSHSLFPQQQVCFCGLPGNNQFLIADLRVNGTCGTSIANPPVGPLLPGYVSMGLGSWTNPNAYPGVQALRWNVGGYDYLDPCVGIPRHEIFYGVTTIGGYPATQLVGGMPGGPLPPIFIDQANSQLSTGATIMNVPFTSLHVLNLNH